MPRSQYSISAVQDELWFSLYDELSKAKTDADAVQIIDKVYSDFQGKYQLERQESQSIDAQVNTLKLRFQ